MIKKNKIFSKFQENLAYIWAILIILLVFLINNVFPAEIITSEVCRNNNCKGVAGFSNLSAGNPVYYVNDVFKSESGKYYRMTFWEKSDSDSKVKVKIATTLSKEKELDVIEFNKNETETLKEVLFTANGEYSDIIFEKNNRNDKANIFIEDIRISKLDISSEKEFSRLRPVISGETSFDVEDQKQLGDSNSYSQLSQPDIILGQIFKPQISFMTGVDLDLDVIKQNNGGGKSYRLELRQADFSGGVPEIVGKVLRYLEFSPEDIEKYRKEDGKFHFPLPSHLDTDKYYFIGINNDKFHVDKFDFLRPKGNRDEDGYKEGSVVIKKSGQTYLVPGDLYFVIYGSDFSEYEGTKILSKTTIEDIGMDKGLFRFQSSGNVYDLADIDSSTSDVDFDYEKESVFGTATTKNESYYIYKLETVFPARKINVYANKADLDWNDVSLSYSGDGKKWEEIPSEKEESAFGLQTFNSSFLWSYPQKTFYLKVSPRDVSSEEKSYGIKNLKVEAELVFN